MKSLDINIGDLFRVKIEYLLVNQVPDANFDRNRSLCLLLRIQKPDGSDAHTEIIHNNSHLLTDDNLDELINSTFYKLMFPRTNDSVWFPEYRFIQIFEPLSKVKESKIYTE